MSRKRKRDWRLPTIKELLALYDEHSQSDKEMENKIYWSSSTSASYTRFAWYLNFYNGYTNNYDKTVTNFVRCVRDTKNGLEWSKAMYKRMTWDQAMRYAEDMNKETL